MLSITPVPSRPSGQKNVLKLTCEPLEVVRIGMIGLGVRAIRAINRFMYIDGIEIKGICDIVPSNIKQAQQILQTHHKPEAAEYAGAETWKSLCERPDIDLLYICTDWETHTPIAVYGMECGKHVALEVPSSTTVSECWQLVDTAEKMRRHCMMLENCCYDPFELTVLNMVQKGILGEIIHAEGAYIHDLRARILSNEYGKRKAGNWQTQYNAGHTGNPYPTHGLGPICQALNMHRGDKMNRLVSMSTQSIGMNLFAKEVYGENSSEAKLPHKLGDMNTTLICTEKEKTMMIQHNIASPRPYSRLYLLNGTKGYVQKYPVPQFAFYPDSDSALNREDMKLLLEKHKHPFLIRIGEKADEVCGGRANDFIMDYRLIHCLRNGLPLDQDVYDAAEWSCLVELTEMSILNGNIPVEIPDFTRGDWNKLSKLEFAG
ncbi:MAG: Gfo/Idh/MocA family oxidoreductase [Dysgonamonadaceae bacterium]|jgi:predicted dehydrogenase|nr:Gfo/Idh/MocA family oxidoreductase [Dysgonamonadaceae bacterium]